MTWIESARDVAIGLCVVAAWFGVSSLLGRFIRWRATPRNPRPPGDE